VRFDPGRLETIGSPTAVVEGVRQTDGQQLLMVKGNDASPAPAYVNVVLNWTRELKD